MGHATLYAYLMAGLFGVCGVFFITIGCCVSSVQVDDGLDASDAAAKEARKSAVKGSRDDSQLLSDV